VRGFSSSKMPMKIIAARLSTAIHIILPSVFQQQHVGCLSTVPKVTLPA
jgi:hypothetical protein